MGRKEKQYSNESRHISVPKYMKRSNSNKFPGTRVIPAQDQTYIAIRKASRVHKISGYPINARHSNTTSALAAVEHSNITVRGLCERHLGQIALPFEELILDVIDR